MVVVQWGVVVVAPVVVVVEVAVAPVHLHVANLAVVAAPVVLDRPVV